MGSLVMEEVKDGTERETVRADSGIFGGAGGCMGSPAEYPDAWATPNARSSCFSIGEHSSLAR